MMTVAVPLAVETSATEVLPVLTLSSWKLERVPHYRSAAPRTHPLFYSMSCNLQEVNPERPSSNSCILPHLYR